MFLIFLSTLTLAKTLKFNKMVNLELEKYTIRWIVRQFFDN